MYRNDNILCGAIQCSSISFLLFGKYVHPYTQYRRWHIQKTYNYLKKKKLIDRCLSNKVTDLHPCELQINPFSVRYGQTTPQLQKYRIFELVSSTTTDLYAVEIKERLDFFLLCTTRTLIRTHTHTVTP